MKGFTFSILLCALISNTVSAQIDYTKIIIPSSATDIELEEKLVQLAWKNHPSNRIFEEQVEIQKEIKKQDRLDWTNNFGISGNVNEFTLNPSADNAGRSAFYPKYNISGRLTLGQIFVSPSEKRTNDHRIKVAMENVNLRKLELRNLVLNTYADYLKFAELFSIQSDILKEAEAKFLLDDQNFKSGLATIEEFESASRQYNLVKKETILVENQFVKAKNDLEFLVGIPLDEIL